MDLITALSIWFTTDTPITPNSLKADLENAIQNIRITKLENRLKSQSEQISRISEKFQTIDDEKFVIFLKDFLFPVTLQLLLEEDQDSKTSLFLNGFENAIDRRISEEIRLLSYFDVMRALRYSDIQYLIYLSNKKAFYSDEVNQGQFYDEYFDNKSNDLKAFTEAKLAQFGLIRMPGQLLAEFEGVNYPFDEAIILTPGKQFLSFYNLIEHQYEVF